jgi:hypothetical protein
MALRNNTRATVKPRETASPLLRNTNGLLAYQQGTQRQQRGAQALIQPGPQPQ